MTTTGRTGARNYRDRKNLSSSESETSLDQIASSKPNMSDKSMSPSYKRRSRSHSLDRSHYRSRKRSYSPRDRSSSPIRKPSHHSHDRFQPQRYDGGRRPYMRFGSHRPFIDRGRGRGMRRPFRGGFPNRNFRFTHRYDQHSQQGSHYKERTYYSPGNQRRRRSYTPSQSRSRSRSRSRSPPNRRSVTPETKRKISRSPSPVVTSSMSTDQPKSSTKSLKENDEKKYSKRQKERRHSSKSDRSKSPENHSPVKRGEAKPSFCREDLEKITVDIHRPVKEPSPTLRHIVNADEVKLVRRVDEGVRPLFEREEIQNPEVDLREEVASERRIISVKDDVDTERKTGQTLQSSGNNVRDYVQAEESSRIPLSKRWEHREDASGSSPSYNRVPKVHSSITHRGYSEDRDQSPVYVRKLSVSPPREGYSRTSSVRDKDVYRDRESSVGRSYSRHYPADPSDLRHSLSSRRKDDSYYETSPKYLDRSDSHHTSSSTSRKHYKVDVDRSRSRSRSPLGSYESHLRERSEERLPDFSQRPDRFKYNAWTDKPEVIPKGPSYYEHDDRDQGGSRPFRSRGFRGSGRFFRPRMNRPGYQSRGGFVPRSIGVHTSRRPYRSSGYIPRTRGYISR